jgi:hypothetical protein
MSDLHNPWGESMALTLDVAARLRTTISTWRLDDAGAAFLLQITPETWHSLRSGDPCPLDRETRMRVDHILDVSDAIRILEPGTDEAAWLRRGHPILGGRSPLDFLLIDGEALRSIRFTMMMDAYPGFPDVPPPIRGRSHQNVPPAGTVGWIALANRWRLALLGRRRR